MTHESWRGNPTHELPIILILGPTAAGKTALAIQLANRLPQGGECICADSMQVYRRMDIGTAKPTPAERARAAHHLLDLVDPSNADFSVDEWLELAEHAVAQVRERRAWPIVVGGTNLYVKALLEGLFDGPAPDPDLRAELEATDPAALRAELEKVDPQSAERIHSNDLRRTVRAIEVHRLRGEPISALQRQWDRGQVRDDALLVGLEYPVEIINQRINARVKLMVDDGLIDEVRELHRAGCLGRQAREALGYKQIIEALDGLITMEEAIEQIKIKTRRFAKQQRTWLRRFRVIPNSIWLNAADVPSETLVNEAVAFIQNHGEG